ncbi:MAG: hypothetical protein KJ056_08255 [Acidimicrobiia bacterium]|nr:hypothetical protein [Acidimicrobiia bacterium]
MVWFAGVVTAAVILAIAVFLVSREVARLRAQPPPPVFDLDEAFHWVVRHVPDDVAATLDADDVRRILDLQIEYFRRKGVSVNGSTPHHQGPVVIGGSETIEYILDRSAGMGVTYLPEQVYAVVETQLAYLKAIGAVGSAAPPSDPEPPEVR